MRQPMSTESDLIAQAVGDLGQNRVACQVADPVVDELEIVEVEDQDRHPAGISLRPLRLRRSVSWK